MGYLFDNCTISVFPPKKEEQRLMHLANPKKLETKLMLTDLLKE